MHTFLGGSKILGVRHSAVRDPIKNVMIRNKRHVEKDVKDYQQNK